ncbi:3878_t:CDS:2, partial [Paraglomus brasilianum]
FHPRPKLSHFLETVNSRHDFIEDKQVFVSNTDEVDRKCYASEERTHLIIEVVPEPDNPQFQLLRRKDAKASVSASA